MTNIFEFELEDFTPFLLNIAAEAASLLFQQHYKQKFGMLRTEWRVVFHLGLYGPMYAKDLSTRARLHKTKVSRAVAALEKKRFLERSEESRDRRHEWLKLTTSGTAAFRDLFNAARRFDAMLMSDFSREEQEILKRCLKKMADV